MNDSKPKALNAEERSAWSGYLDGLRDAEQAAEDCTDSFGNLYRLDWLDRMKRLREDAERVLDGRGVEWTVQS